MVTLPKLNSYSLAEKKVFSAYSPLYSHYESLLSREPKSISEEIRQLKHTHWLECAFATLSGTLSSEEICHYWSNKAEEILKKAWLECELDKHEIALIAFGKLGSRELNLSSDIDIVFVKSDSEDSTELNGKVKSFIRLLSETTPFGFVFRTDTNLRPGGGAAPLVPTISVFTNFYNEYTEAWNRLSFIRLRPLIGPKSLMEEVADFCQRLSYPRRLDFSIIKELKGIRSKLEFQWRKASEPFDIKFHPGGIRDIELYIHALQVIYGGRNPNIQSSSITHAISNLGKMGFISKEDQTFLHNFYWDLRTIENHIHIFEDQHTYVLKSVVLDKIKSIFPETMIIRGLERTTDICDDFFVNDDIEDPSTDLDRINSLSENNQKLIQEILNIQSHSFKKPEHQIIKKSIIHKYLSALERIGADESLAIQIFRDFVTAIRSKSSLFYLLNRNDELLENLAWLFSSSPYAGQILCHRPELIDSFVLGRVAIDPSGDLENLLEDLNDYKLLGQLVSIIYFFKDQDVVAFTKKISEQADFAVMSLLNNVLKEEKIEILTMGKWSGFELGIRSDLDFVFLTDSEPSQIQVKLARKFIHLLTTNNRAGKLYNIDLRLKPQQGSVPLLIKKERLFHFLQSKAEPWQKQAYLRTRLVGQTAPFLQDSPELLKLSATESADLAEIHQKLIVPATEESIDLKYCEGGIIHTEFLLQRLCLTKGAQPKNSSTQSIFNSLELSSHHQNIITNYHKLRRFEQIVQICKNAPNTKVGIRDNNLPRINELTNSEDAFQELQALVSLQSELLKCLT